MRIERVSENQIRCILNISDLRERHISLPELAYGSDKAKNLFREMMDKAESELDFEAEGIPLMIEAIPMPGENLALIITRVEDPDELDTRFARFAPSLMAGSDPSENMEEESRFGIADILKAAGLGPDGESGRPREKADREVTYRVFVFKDLDSVRTAARVLSPIYRGENSLYHRASSDNYYLIARMGKHTPEEYNKVCNILTEFSQQLKAGYSSEGYCEEHYTRLYKKNALKRLLAE